MEFISEIEANLAKERITQARKIAKEESYYSSIGLSVPSKWAKEDKLEREQEQKLKDEWRKTDNYKETIRALKSGALLQIFP